MSEANGSEIFIEENAPRDGIQNEAVPFSVEERIALIDRLSACGFKRIQVGSFVNPRRVPQMAETERVLEAIRKAPGVVYSALVLNERGLDRAMSCGVEHVSLFVSASETHSRKNSNCSVQEATDLMVRLIDKAKRQGVGVQAGVMNAFRCHFEGAVPLERVEAIVEHYVRAGADEINLADTPGLAHPALVVERVCAVREFCGLPLSLHLHDTCGFGLVNLYAAWQAGVTRFDASCGGLGGCPFIPGAAGNVATEDVVHLFERSGLSTGISLERLAAVVAFLEHKLQRMLPGRYARTKEAEEGKPI